MSMAADRRHMMGGTLAAAAAAALLGGSDRAHAQAAKVVLGTATPGGGFPVYGAAVVDALRTVDPELVVEARNTKGSTENVPMLERGELDLGLVTGEVAYEALTGIGRAPAKLTILTAMYSQPGLFVVRADSPARSIADLRGKPVAFGAKGSGLVVLARYVLDGMGLDIERDFTAIYLDRAGDGPAMVQDGRAAALWGAGSGWPGFTAVASAPGGARFIAPTDEQARAILAKHPFLKPMVVPAGSYPGLDTPLTSLGSWSFIMARPDLDEAVAYRLARALHRAEPELGRLLPQARETTAANTVAALPDPALLHPGAARYLREAGFLK
jgi:TRAP transporter TAXI family solute receptor